MTDKRKLSKAEYLTVVTGEKGNRTNGYSTSEISELHQYFRMQPKHLKGSNRPAGWFHERGMSDYTVEVRWLWTEELAYFAPEVCFRATSRSIKVSQKIGKALVAIRNDPDEGPEKLTDTLAATVVEYVESKTEGCWNDYRPLRIPGEPAMVTLARYAL